VFVALFPATPASKLIIINRLLLLPTPYFTRVALAEAATFEFGAFVV